MRPDYNGHRGAFAPQVVSSRNPVPPGAHRVPITANRDTAAPAAPVRYPNAPLASRYIGKRFGQQTPRRWGWGTPLKKRTATRITTKLKPTKILSTSYLGSPGRKKMYSFGNNFSRSSPWTISFRATD